MAEALMVHQKIKFGTYIKGARLVYHWSDRIGGFMRMTPLENGAYRIELEPADTDFCESKHSKKDKTPRIVWWRDANDLEDSDAVIDMIPCLRINRVKKRIVFDIDDSGNLIKNLKVDFVNDYSQNK